MSWPVLPGSTIGIIGGGQLGKMMAQSAQQLGYFVSVLDPDPNAPACRITNHRILGQYDDDIYIQLLSRDVDVITFEFENIDPTPLMDLASDEDPLVHPAPELLFLAKGRSREKKFAAICGFDCTDYVGNLQLDRSSKSSIDTITTAIKKLGDCIVKTEHGGYDGKGQLRINAHDTQITGKLIEFHWQLNTNEPVAVIVEQSVSFELEFSLIVARFADETFQMFPPFENQHRNGILHTTICPADIPEEALQEAFEATKKIMIQLSYYGVLTVEFFFTSDGEVLFNEMAPRPHNSGHLTIEAFSASQFEQHIRSVCGLPGAVPLQRKPAGMLNLVAPFTDIDDLVEITMGRPDTHLHLYGKQESRPGRKMGHITVLADSIAGVRQQLAELDQLIYSD